MHSLLASFTACKVLNLDQLHNWNYQIVYENRFSVRKYRSQSRPTSLVNAPAKKIWAPRGSGPVPGSSSSGSWQLKLRAALVLGSSGSWQLQLWAAPAPGSFGSGQLRFPCNSGYIQLRLRAVPVPGSSGSTSRVRVVESITLTLLVHIWRGNFFHICHGFVFWPSS